LPPIWAGLELRVENQGKIDVSSIRKSAAIVLFALGVFAAPLSAQAQMSVQRYKEIRDTPGSVADNTAGWYMAGVFEAFELMELVYEANKAPALFCIPRASLQLGSLVFLVDEELAQQKEVWRKNPTQSVATFTIEVLRRRLPCN
jgi:hypothetical protein